MLFYVSKAKLCSIEVSSIWYYIMELKLFKLILDFFNRLQRINYKIWLLIMIIDYDWECIKYIYTKSWKLCLKSNGQNLQPRTILMVKIYY